MLLSLGALLKVELLPSSIVHRLQNSHEPISIRSPYPFHFISLIPDPFQPFVVDVLYVELAGTWSRPRESEPINDHGQTESQRIDSVDVIVLGNIVGR